MHEDDSTAIPRSFTVLLVREKAQMLNYAGSEKKFE